jgi:uncharacterized protein
MIAEAVDIQAQLQEKWIVFWWSLGIGLVALGIAWQRGLFKPFHASPFPVIRGIEVLKGFAVFLFVELIFVPIMIGLVLTFMGIDAEKFIKSHQEAKGWFNLLIMLGGFIGVSFVFFGLKAEKRQQLWQQTSTPWYFNYGIGIAVWFVSYPLVLAFSQIASIAAWHFIHHSFVEQVVVQHLRKTLPDPLLFAVTGLAIVTIVPLTEEFLFRGLLQSWLKRKLHATGGIVLSSLIFAIFHFSEAQGVTNFELLTSLFLLSCMLGYIYERQRSLWASVGLHSFFNFMSLVMIFKEP